MNASTRWLGWTAIVLVGHMTEQLMFGLVELQRLKDFFGIYDTWFRSLDTATVTLVTIVAFPGQCAAGRSDRTGWAEGPRQIAEAVASNG